MFILTELPYRRKRKSGSNRGLLGFRSNIHKLAGSPFYMKRHLVEGTARAFIPPLDGNVRGKTRNVERW